MRTLPCDETMARKIIVALKANSIIFPLNVDVANGDLEDILGGDMDIPRVEFYAVTVGPEKHVAVAVEGHNRVTLSTLYVPNNQVFATMELVSVPPNAVFTYKFLDRGEKVIYLGRVPHVR